MCSKFHHHLSNNNKVMIGGFMPPPPSPLMNDGSKKLMPNRVDKVLHKIKNRHEVLYTL